MTATARGGAGGRQPPWVFLHGYPLDHRIWEPVLAERGAPEPAWAPDLPGYGSAGRAAVPRTLRGFSEWVRAEVESRVDGPAVIVGHSFGGYIALQLYADHPGLFAGLVLADTRSEADPPEARAKRRQLIEQLSEPGGHLDIDGVVKGLVAPAMWAGQGVVVGRLRRIVGDVPAPTASATLAAIAERPGLGPVLPKIRVPTLVVWGEEDQLIPPEQTRGLVSRIAGARGQGLPGAGHLPAMETPAAFVHACRTLTGVTHR